MSRCLLRFDDAFRRCVAEGVHPGPMEITKRIEGRTPTHKLNGDESKRRLQLMRLYKIPYQRDGAYGNKGEIPREKELTAMEQVQRQRLHLGV